MSTPYASKIGPEKGNCNEHGSQGLIRSPMPMWDWVSHLRNCDALSLHALHVYPLYLLQHIDATCFSTLHAAAPPCR